MQNGNLKFKTNLKEKCYKFSISIIKLTDNLPNKRSAWVITDQIIRSSTSIGANLTEARASSSRLEFKKFYEIALKSGNETVYWLNMLKDTFLAKQEIIDPLIEELSEINKMLASSVISLKSKL